MDAWIDEKPARFSSLLSTDSINLNASVSYDPQAVPSGTTIYQYDLDEEKKTKNTEPLDGQTLFNKHCIFVIANVTTLAVLLTVGLGLGIGLKTTTIKNYNDSCTNTSECAQYGQYGLICVNQVCICTDTGYYYQSSCLKRKSYLYKCGNTNECDSYSNLMCQNINETNVCACIADRLWNGTHCTSFGIYNSPCNNASNECQTLYGLTCLNSSCTCPINYFWNGTNCDNVRTFNETCTANNSCESTKSLYCNLQGMNAGKCTCNNLLFWNNITCLNQKTINSTCTPAALDCRSDLGLDCDIPTNRCICNSTFFWSTTSQKCLKRPTYNEVCNTQTPCYSILLLICTSNRCQCPSGYYWEGTQCIRQKTIGGMCSANNQCMSTQSLVCSLANCRCPSTMFWNNTACVPKYTRLIPCVKDIQCQDYNKLTCQNNTCLCIAGFTWSAKIPTCVVPLSYNKTCNNIFFVCNPDLLLVCQSRKCICQTNYYWNNSICIPQKTFGVSCANDGECLTTAYLYCNGVCTCPFDKFWNMATCQRKLTNALACSSSYQCQDFSRLSCQNSTCQCDSGWTWSVIIDNCYQCPPGNTCGGSCTPPSIWSPSSNTCVLTAKYNETCYGTLVCDSTLNLTCQSYRCLCPYETFWNGSFCEYKRSYGELCSNDTECIDSGLLICNTTCSCTYDKYWNGTKCVPKLTLNETCSNTGECRDYFNLVCRNNTCQCPTAPDWFWATSTERCVSCPSNWTIYYNNHCYFVNTVKMNWYNASSWCQSNLATLLIIRNTAEYNIVYNFYNSSTPGGRIWIGSTSTSVFDFIWQDDSFLDKDSPFWCAGEPNNAGGNNNLGIIAEPSVFMWNSGGRVCLSDYTATSTEISVCEKSA